MTIVSAKPVILPAAVPVLAEGRNISADFWRAPLVPVALFTTAGIILDRLVGVALSFSLAVVLASLLAWLITLTKRRTGLAVFLGCA